jgi:hypothetical protein
MVTGFVPPGTNGFYSVDVALQRLDQSPLRDGQTVAAQLIEGSSYFALGEPAVKNSEYKGLHIERVWPDKTTTRVVFSVNSEGFLSRLHIEELPASSFGDADRKARELIHPILSNLSLKYDVPVKVAQFDVTEKSTGTLRTAVRVGPRFAIPLEKEMVIGPMLRGLSSLYREGMNSTSPTYAFLCFYKIIESIKKRREHIGQICRSYGEPPLRFEAVRIPAADPELANLAAGAFPKSYQWDAMTVSQVFRVETRSKKLFDVFDKYLTPLRNRIAHALLDSGEFADLDDPKLLRDIEEWLPFTRFAARIALLTDMKVELPPVVSNEFEKRLTDRNASGAA